MTATAFPRLFISYSRVDSAFVDRLEQDLAVRDVHVWVDRRKLEGSQIWAAEIQKGIDQAEIVLVVVSPEAMASEWVQREISYAVGKHKPIIPLVWRSADVPITIFNLQALPFEGRYENGLRELLVTLTKIPTMPTPISHATPSIATMDAPAPAVRLVQPVAPPPAPDADLNNLFIAAIAAETSSDIERALLFFEQITARDPQFGNGFAARKITDLAPRVIEQRIQRLRERARAATTANEWHAAAGAWDALLTIVPDDSEARDGVHDELLHIMQNAADQGDWGEALGACAAVIERFPGNVTANAAQGILRQNYDAAWLYDNARVLADAGDAPSARAMLGVLWQQAPHFGDPSGVARGLGLAVAAFSSLLTFTTSLYIAETRAIMNNPTRQGELLLATLRGHSGYVQSVAWSPDGTRLASGSFDQTVRVWEVSTGKELATLRGHRGYVRSVAWSPDGTRLVSAGDDATVRVWEVSTGKELATLRGHSDAVHSVTWSPDGTRLASGGFDNTVRVWEVSMGKELAMLDGHSGYVRSVAWSPDGKRLVSAGRDTKIRVWEVSTGKELATLYGHRAAVHSVTWSPDGTRLVSGGDDSTVLVWEVSTGGQLAMLGGHSGYVLSVAWSPDGKRLVSGGLDTTIRVWEVSTRKELATLRGHSGYALSVAWSPDGKHVASSSADGTICIWRA